MTKKKITCIFIDVIKHLKSKKMKPEERTLIAMRKDIHREFKIHCVQNGLVMTELTTKLIKEYLEQNSK